MLGAKSIRQEGNSVDHTAAREPICALSGSTLTLISYARRDIRTLLEEEMEISRSLGSPGDASKYLLGNSLDRWNNVIKYSH